MLTVAMIAKNEEALITDALQSVRQIADEIVLIDTGSTDRTVDIATSIGARVIVRPWDDDFSAARNAAIEASREPWILMIDADETWVDDDTALLHRVLRDPQADAYLLRITSVLDQNQEVTASVARLFRNDPRIRFRGRIHEQIWPAIEEAGLRLMDSPLRIRHQGYQTAITATKQKNERNFRLLRRTLKDDPIDAYAWYQLGQTLMATHQERRSVTAYRKALEFTRRTDTIRPLAFVGLAKAYVQLDRWDDVDAITRKGLADYPDYVDLLYWQGVASVERHDLSTADQLFMQCLTVRPQKEYAQTDLAVASFLPKVQLAILRSQTHPESNESLAWILSALKDNPVWPPSNDLFDQLVQTSPPDVIRKNLMLIWDEATLHRWIQFRHPTWDHLALS